MTDLALVLALLLLVQSIVALRGGYDFLRYVRRRRREPLPDYTPRAVVIIPCKGVDSHFEKNVLGFLTQDYPGYQIVFVVASQADPSYAALENAFPKGSAEKKAGAPATTLVVAGYSDVRGEKVNNLLKGLAVANPEAQVFVFADIDIRPGHDWLRSLVAPLADPGVTVNTGFRWYLPEAAFVSQLRAAWDTSVATLLGDHGRNFAWGGSMAMRVADFRGLGIAERHWARTVSDDYAVTRAVRDARGTIHFEPRCLLASRADSSFRDFLRWANRQIIITRVYSPGLWWTGLVTNALYCGTFAMGVISIALTRSITERIAVMGILFSIVLLGAAKGRIRGIVAREIFPEQSEALRYGSCYWRLAPLVPWVMLFNLIMAGLTRRIEWQGTHYELRSDGEVRVIQRR